MCGMIYAIVGNRHLVKFAKPKSETQKKIEPMRIIYKDRRDLRKR